MSIARARREVHELLQLAPGAGEVRAVDRHLILVARAPACRRPGSASGIAQRALGSRRAARGPGRSPAGSRRPRASPAPSRPRAGPSCGSNASLCSVARCDRRAADLHRLEHRVRIERAGAPDVHADARAAASRRCRARTCARSPSAARGSPSSRARPARVSEFDLHDHAIDPEVELGAQLVLHRVRERDHLRQRRAVPPVRLDRDPPRVQLLEQLPLRREGEPLPLGQRDREAEEAQGALRRLGGIELAQRARRRVARIREDRLARPWRAPRSAPRRRRRGGSTRRGSRRARAGPVPASRSGIPRTVRRFAVTTSPVVPLPRVAPVDEHAALVREAHRRAVDLELGGVAARHRRAGMALHRLLSHAAQLVVVEGVARARSSARGARAWRGTRPAARRRAASGESGVRSAGCAASRSCSSRKRRSYSRSESSGRSST